MGTQRGLAPESMRITRLVLILGLLGSIMLAHQMAEASSPSVIKGKIYDPTGKTITGARVTLSEKSFGFQAIAYTDTNGAYGFTNLSPGHYLLEASRDGSTQSASVDLGAVAQDVEHDLELSSSSHRFHVPPANSLAYLLMTAFVPALFVLFFTRPMQSITLTFWQFTQRAIYSALAPRFPNRIGIPGYKKRILRSDLAYLENLVGPPQLKVRLERAFAPITVVSDSSKSGIDPFAFAAASARFIMLGGPGTGKTTLMKSLVINIVRGMVSEELSGLIPVFILLREMAQAQHTVEEAIVAAFSRFGLPRSQGFVEAALSKGRLLIILDGLDEVGPNRKTVTEAIRKFCQLDNVRDHSNRLVVTCREMSYRTRDLSDVIPTVARVDPFTPQHMRVFLKGWPPYQDRLALRLYGELEKAPPVRESCRNPLLLSILTGLYLQSAAFDLPSSRDEFYRTAINELLVNRPARRGIEQEFSERDKWLLLQRLSLSALVASSPGQDEEKLSRAEIFARAREILGDEHKEASFRKLLNELVEVNGILRACSHYELAFC